MRDFVAADRALVKLLYTTYLDLRLPLLLDKIGFQVRPVSHIERFLVSRQADDGGTVLIDADTEFEHCTHLVQRLAARLEHSPLIVICKNGTPDFFRHCFMAGATDVLDKSLEDPMIAQALVAASQGSYAQSACGRRRRARFKSLTGREREMFRYLVDGYTSREIAQLLELSVRTVDTHRANLLEKLIVRNVAQMAGEYAAVAHIS